MTFDYIDILLNLLIIDNIDIGSILRVLLGLISRGGWCLGFVYTKGKLSTKGSTMHEGIKAEEEQGHKG